MLLKKLRTASDVVSIQRGYTLLVNVKVVGEGFLQESVVEGFVTVLPGIATMIKEDSLMAMDCLDVDT